VAYYSNINPDLLQLVPLTARRVLEIGCGEGNFARAWLGRNPNAQYFGVELFESAAQEATQHLTRVVCGDIEQPSVVDALDAAADGEAFDTLVFGDVLEHLRDPWQVLAMLRAHMTPDALCAVCIPNVSHWSLVQQLLRGRWDYADAGLLDRTHLRFFTRDTAVELLQQAGWTVLDARPRVLWPDKTEAALSALLPLATAMGVPVERMRQDLSAFQWVIRAVNGPQPQRIHVAGLGMQKCAGVTEARIDHPLTALNSLPGARAVWGAGGLSIPRDFSPGVLVLHRQFMNDAAANAHFEQCVAKGWLLVSEIDDDPHHWREFVESDFYAYRAVHAVTVSTEPLANMIRQWNPNVQVFPNAILELPPQTAQRPDSGQRLRIFFGALNRSADWASMQAGVLAAAAELAGAVEFVVVHDDVVSKSLAAVVNTEFHPTLPYAAYMDLLRTCHVALLPLNDTPFNRLKSDLKFIECCAAGVVPVCSPVVYAERPEHHEIGLFAETADQWKHALLALASDPNEVAQRAALGRDYVRRHRMHSQQAPEREAYYQGLLANRAALESERRARMKSAAR
jgi:2-polyprenyl-3-methyl-5-hydroxy-6-metoxy-1,4-benzoquinol methylase